MKDKLIKEKLKLVSLPSSSDHYEVIKELGFKEHFLTTTNLLPIFVDYHTPLLTRYLENMGKKTKATKLKCSVAVTTSSGGENSSREEE